ncbi:MAG: hypothetical protein KAH20_12640 [Methylococcales bacterium]|nr:hypothetical protein [Methylococcales bacterium]
MSKAHLYLAILFFLCSCTASTPKRINNICDIFKEKDDWYDDAKESAKKWGVPIHVTMAIMHQESHFVADAKPPRRWILGIIPWSRPSSAYGYAQALDGTWQKYLNQNDSWGEDRDDFSDASDFIGWYCTISHRKLGISKTDTKNLYLAYHEGYAGYSRKSYLKKRWLKKVAKKVNRKSKQYQRQLLSCKEELESTGWFFW